MPASHTNPVREPGLSHPAGGERLADRLADFLARVSPHADLLFASTSGAEWLGYPESGLQKGASLLSIVAPEDHGVLLKTLEQSASHARQSLALRLLRQDGCAVRVTCRILPLVAVGGHVELLFAAWDVGDPPGQDQGLETIAPPDFLTGLPTRVQLMRKLADLTRPDRPQAEGFALLHLGLDGFQKINDALGHAAGD